MYYSFKPKLFITMYHGLNFNYVLRCIVVLNLHYVLRKLQKHVEAFFPGKGCKWRSNFVSLIPLGQTLICVQ